MQIQNVKTRLGGEHKKKYDVSLSTLCLGGGILTRLYNVVQTTEQSGQIRQTNS